MDAVDNFHHVARDTNVAALVGHCSRHCLAYPPCCVRGELKALLKVVLIGSVHQADIAFLYQVGQLQLLAVVTPRYGHNQAQVGANHVLLCLFSVAYGSLQRSPFANAKRGRRLIKLLLGL